MDVRRLLLLALLLAPGCRHAGEPPAAVPRDVPPPVPRADRELRAAWVATVANIDWPSRPGLDASEQRCEALAILDTAARLGLNAIVLQVRPHADALYRSELEPWSAYLTGAEGRPPEPEYDPLDFWVEEAHDRGLELHAWFNPFRAHMPAAGPVTEASIVAARPELVRALPNGSYWLDPAMGGTQDHSLAVVMDVVHRYDVDAVHFDDYFYPYGDGTFPDDATWEAYRASGGALSRSDWRRDAVNRFVLRVSRGIKAVKPRVKLGISPFGIWRPGHPPSVAGFDQYEGLYADARLWLREGWVDYFSPQLYWPVNQIPQSFPVLLGWWSRENPKQRHLWPGMIVGKMTDEKGADEIVNQVMITRGFVPEAPGHIHFSMKALLREETPLSRALRAGPYARPALVPATPWLDAVPPAAPSVSSEPSGGVLRLGLSHPVPGDVFRWVVSAVYESGATVTVLNRGARSAEIPLTRTRPRPSRRDATAEPAPDVTEKLLRVAVSAIDRLGNESEPAPVTVP